MCDVCVVRVFVGAFSMTGDCAEGPWAVLQPVLCKAIYSVQEQAYCLFRKKVVY